MRSDSSQALRRDSFGEADASPVIAPKDRLRAAYGLTAAEARVALLMGDGLTITEIAAHVDSSIHTVRAQLSAVFAKTGCHRQTDLVRLVLLRGSGALRQ